MQTIIYTIAECFAECFAFVAFFAVAGAICFAAEYIIYKAFSAKSKIIRAIWDACNPANDL